MGCSYVVCIVGSGFLSPNVFVCLHARLIQLSGSAGQMKDLTIVGGILIKEGTFM